MGDELVSQADFIILGVMVGIFVVFSVSEMLDLIVV
jgi:hypothetical protein